MRKRIVPLAIAATLLALAMLRIPSVYGNGSGLVRVSYINVEQGDSILLRDSNGFDVLVDGGKPPVSATILAYLRALGVDDIDVMVATHADSDHIGGLIGGLQATDIPVASVLYNGYPDPDNSLTWQSFVGAVVSEGLTLTVAQYPSELAWGAMKAYVLNPASLHIKPRLMAGLDVMPIAATVSWPL